MLARLSISGRVPTPAPEARPWQRYPEARIRWFKASGLALVLETLCLAKPFESPRKFQNPRSVSTAWWDQPRLREIQRSTWGKCSMVPRPPPHDAGPSPLPSHDFSLRGAGLAPPFSDLCLSGAHHVLLRPYAFHRQHSGVRWGPRISVAPSGRGGRGAQGQCPAWPGPRPLATSCDTPRCFPSPARVSTP